MPWDAESFEKHNHSATPAQAKKGAAQASAILAKTGDEGMALAVANKNIKHQKLKRRGIISKDAEKRVLSRH